MTGVARGTVGIDLGTSKTAVAIYDPETGCPRVLQDAAQRNSLPSLVMVTADRQISVGHEALHHKERYNAEHITISSVKRMVGRQGETGWGWWKAHPQEVSAHVLAAALDQASRALGASVERAVIAIPSHFDEAQRRATWEACTLAGVIPLRLLNEATAAALAYGATHPSPGNMLVFDMGAGTTDVSVINAGEGVYEVLSIEGESKLGGDDFTMLIIQHVLKQCGAANAWQSMSLTQQLVLREASETAKIQLSGALQARVYLPGFFNGHRRVHQLDCTLTREIFEELSENLVNRATGLIRKAIDKAACSLGDVNICLCLGGACRLPVLRKRVVEDFGLHPFTGVDVETAVVQGAAIQAGVLDGIIPDTVVLDILPSSYGIATKGGNFDRIICKNTTIPTRASKVFSTTEHNQHEIVVSLFQGESVRATDNTYVGQIKLANLPSEPSGVPQIEVTFDVDANMMVHASVHDLGSGQKCLLDVRSPHGLNETQIRIMSQRLSGWREQMLTRLRISDDVLATDAEIRFLLTEGKRVLSREVLSKLERATQYIQGQLVEQTKGDLPALLVRMRKFCAKHKAGVEQSRRNRAFIDETTRSIEAVCIRKEPEPCSEIERLSQGIQVLQGNLERGATEEDAVHFADALMKELYRYIASELVLWISNSVALLRSAFAQTQEATGGVAEWAELAINSLKNAEYESLKDLFVCIPPDKREKILRDVLRQSRDDLSFISTVHLFVQQDPAFANVYMGQLTVPQKDAARQAFFGMAFIVLRTASEGRGTVPLALALAENASSDEIEAMGYLYSGCLHAGARDQICAYFTRVPWVHLDKLIQSLDQKTLAHFLDHSMLLASLNFTDASEPTAYQIMRALVLHPFKSVADTWESLLSARNPKVRANAFIMLGSQHPKNDVVGHAALRYLKNSEPTCRDVAITHFADNPNRDGSAALRLCFSTQRSPDVRLRVLGAISSDTSLDVTAFLIRTMIEGNSEESDLSDELLTPRLQALAVQDPVWRVYNLLQSYRQLSCRRRWWTMLQLRRLARRLHLPDITAAVDAVCAAPGVIHR